MQELGMQNDMLSVLRVLSFILLLGNLEFVDLEESGIYMSSLRPHTLAA
jgi:hypothetical protein